MSSYKNNNYINSLNQLKQQHFINIQKKRKEKLRQDKLRKDKLRKDKLRQEQLRQDQLIQEQLRQEQLRQQQFIQEQLRLEIQSYDNYINLRTFFNINEEYEVDNVYVNNVLSIDFFNKLKRTEYKNKYNTSCPICITDFNDKENIIELNCHHNFHHDCIKKWLCERSNSCPLCKTCV